MTEFPLQKLVERHGCKYFAENDTGDGAVLHLALHSPFIRLYALNRNVGTVEAQKLRFQDNERMQLFEWTHEQSWLEVVRLMPVDQPSLFWMHPSENVSRALAVVGKLRPQRKDVLVFEPGSQRGAVHRAEYYFRATHWLSVFSDDFGELTRVPDWQVAENPTRPVSYVVCPRAAG